MTRITSYQDLRRAIAQRRRDLGLTQEEAGDAAGLQQGYLAKLEAGIRNFGYLSLPMTLAALDLDLILAAKEEIAA